MAVTAPRPPAPVRRPGLFARVRRSLSFDFAEIDALDLGTPAEIDREAARLFERGGHVRARA